MDIKPILKPEGSIVAGLATMGLVYAIFQNSLGPSSVAHATMPGTDTSVLSSELRKSGWTALIAVAGISLLARDATIAILGGASIMALEVHYRHAILSHPVTGQITAPGPAAYSPAQAAVPLMLQGPTG